MHTLVKYVEDWRDKVVAIVGDSIIDRFVFTSRVGESREAPGVPRVVPVRRTECLGGAGNVAANVAALGGAPTLLTVIGGIAGERDEHYHKIFRRELEIRGIEDTSTLDTNRRTTVKTRTLVDDVLVLDTDDQDTVPISDQIVKGILTRLERMRDVSVVVVSDYGRGVVTPALMDGVREWCAQHNQGGAQLLVDPRPRDGVNWRTLYRGADVVKPSVKEAQQILGRSFEAVDTDEVARAANDIRKELGGAVIITRGPYGITLVDKQGDVLSLPARASREEVKYVSGCGDTVVGTLALAMTLKDIMLAEAMAMANAAAAVAVRQEGTVAVTASALKAEMLRGGEAPPPAAR